MEFRDETGVEQTAGNTRRDALGRLEAQGPLDQCGGAALEPDDGVCPGQDQGVLGEAQGDAAVGAGAQLVALADDRQGPCLLYTSDAADE